MKNRTRGLRRWFLISGLLGVLVALVLMTLAAYHVVVHGTNPQLL